MKRFKLLFLTNLCLIIYSPVFGQWQPDYRLTNNDSLSYVSFIVARNIVAENEFVHAVWADDCDSSDYLQIYYARSTDQGLTWEPATHLADDTTVSFEPAMVAADGYVHVVWTALHDSINLGLYYKRSPDNGATWSNDRLLTTTGLYEYASPCLAVDGQTLHLVWTDFRGFPLRVYYKRSPDLGFSWGPDIVISTSDSNAAYGSICAVDSVVHLAWAGFFPGERAELFYRRSTNDGLTWEPSIQLTSGTVAATLINPQVAVVGALVHITCIHRPVDKYEAVYVRSPDRGQSWGEPTRLFSTPGEHVGRTTVAADGNNVHAATHLFEDSINWIYYRNSTDGGLNWGQSVRLSDSGSADYVSIALCSSAVHLLWRDNRDGNYEIYYKRNPTGNIGIDESSLSQTAYPKPGPTIISDVLNLQSVIHNLKSEIALLDITGRKVTDLKPGVNDIRHLAPGVYFLRLGAKYKKFLLVK